MNNIEQAMKAVEEAEKQLKAAKESLEKAKTNNIGLKLPVNFSTDVVYFRNLTGHYDEDRDSTFTKEGIRSCFASTNKAQAKAFAEALQVMAELRCQEGIKFPDDGNNWEILWDMRSEDLGVYCSCHIHFQMLSPFFVSAELVKKAIDNVGKERIIAAYKTMMFMTPESRGEI